MDNTKCITTASETTLDNRKCTRCYNVRTTWLYAQPPTSTSVFHSSSARQVATPWGQHRSDGSILVAVNASATHASTTAIRTPNVRSVWNKHDSTTRDLDTAQALRLLACRFSLPPPASQSLLERCLRVAAKWWCGADGTAEHGEQMLLRHRRQLKFGRIAHILFHLFLP